MEEKVEAFRNRSKEEADVLIARELDRIYSGKNFADPFKIVKKLDGEEYRKVTRFYDGLLRQIKKYKKNFTPKVWRNAGSAAAAQAQQAQPVQQTQPQFVAYVSYNGQLLELYSSYENYAWNRAANQWVQLPPNTLVYTVKPGGQWEPNMTDAQGNVYLQMGDF